MGRERAAPLVLLLALAPALASSGCGERPSAFRDGREAARRGQWDEAVRLFERAAAERPDDVEIRIALTHARLDASHAHLDLARSLLDVGELERGATELERALELDPTNRYATEELAETRARLAGGDRPEAPPPSSLGEDASPAAEVLISLSFEDTSLRDVLETLAELAGVNLLFDEAYRDRNVSVKLEAVTLRQALDLLTETQGLFYTLDEPSRGTAGRVRIAR